MDQEAQQLLARGHRDAAFEALVDRFHLKVFRLIYSIVGDAAQAEDVTQDTFFKVWLALPNYDGRAAFSTWIYTIARNTSLTHVRSQSYRKTGRLEDAVEPAGFTAPMGQSLEIERLLARLPEDQRQAVQLFYLQERSVSDVAEMMDLPEGTVKSHLSRARKAMGRMLG